TRRLGRVLLRVADGELGLEKEAERQGHALRQLHQEQALDPAANRVHAATVLRFASTRLASNSTMARLTVQAPKIGSGMPSTMAPPSTASHRMVSGMNTFQPSRMIWS